MKPSSHSGSPTLPTGRAGSPEPAILGTAPTQRPAGQRPGLAWPACLPAAVLTLLLAGCASPKSLPEQPTPGTEAAALYGVDLQFSAQAQTLGVAEAFRQFLADRAILLPNGELPVVGLDAIYQHQQAAAGVQLSWKPVAAEVARSGDLGFTWGFYEVRLVEPDGTVQTGHGKYTTIWAKQPDGQWKVILDTGNPGPPPVPTERGRGGRR